MSLEELSKNININVHNEIENLIQSDKIFKENLPNILSFFIIKQKWYAYDKKSYPKKFWWRMMHIKMTKDLTKI